MLIKNDVLARIRSGDVDLVFRRWKRAGVKTGTHLHTAVGLVSVDDCSPCRIDEITETDARRAGFSTREELTTDMASRDGTIFRISVSYLGDDPRIALRERVPEAEVELAEITDRLRRWDHASRTGAWTFRTLQLIDANPHRAAGDLADIAGTEKDRLKRRVRQLKNLGLTVSHHPGYEISPRGRAVLDYLVRNSGERE